MYSSLPASHGPLPAVCVSLPGRQRPPVAPGPASRQPAMGPPGPGAHPGLGGLPELPLPVTSGKGVNNTSDPNIPHTLYSFSVDVE